MITRLQTAATGLNFLSPNQKTMKDRISITLDDNLLAWIDAKIATKEFANRSHALEVLMQQKILQEKNAENEF